MQTIAVPFPTGDHVAIKSACDKATARGALSAKPLTVGGAFHTAHMALAQEEVKKVPPSLVIIWDASLSHRMFWAKQVGANQLELYLSPRIPLLCFARTPPKGCLLTGFPPPPPLEVADRIWCVVCKNPGTERLGLKEKDWAFF